jgi:hypothetical protein
MPGKILKPFTMMMSSCTILSSVKRRPFWNREGVPFLEFGHHPRNVPDVFGRALAPQKYPVKKKRVD